jgi:hypothetical protein
VIRAVESGGRDIVADILMRNARAWRGVWLLATWLAASAGCRQRPTPPEETAKPAAIATSSAAEAAASTVVTAPGPPTKTKDTEGEDRDDGDAPIELGGDRLMKMWPTLVGKRVRMRAKVERALDVTRAVVSADGSTFLVNLAPDQLWTGTKAETFRVMGRGSAPIGGKTAMVELLLESP